jgi:hypothetical protein
MIKISDKLYSLLVTIVILAGTFIFPWWTIPAGIFGVSIFYVGSRLKAAAISTGLAITLWVGIAMIRDGIAEEKASSLVGSILGNIAPSLVFTLTGLIIGTVAGLAATSGKLTSLYLRKE